MCRVSELNGFESLIKWTDERRICKRGVRAR